MPKKISPEVARDAIAKYGSSRKAAKHLGVHNTTVSRQANKIKETPPEQPPIMEKALDILYMDKKKPKDLSLEDILSAFKNAQEFRSSLSIKQLEATIKVPTNRPIALSFFSDVHIGSQFTNYHALENDINKIIECRDIFVMLGGDISDKMQTFRNVDTAAGHLHPTQVQLIAEERLIDTLGDKLLAKIGGNHDVMDAKRSGVDSNFYINRGRKYPYLPFGGFIKLIVGKITYGLLWKHRYRYNSTINQFNSHHRMLEMLEPTADVVVQEHEHNPGIESVERFEYDSRKTVISVRTGTYKLDDPYSVEFFKSGRVAPQTIIFFPDKRKILGLHGEDAINDANHYLRGYNV